MQGNMAFKARDWSGAANAYTEALRVLEREGAPPEKKLLSNRSAARFQAAKQLKKEGDRDVEALRALDGAVADGGAVVEIDPAWEKGWCRIGVALIESGRYGECVGVLERGVMASGGGKEVGELLEKAREYVRTFEAPSVKARLKGNRLAKEGDLEEAVVAYGMAVKLSEDEKVFVDKGVYSGRCQVLLELAALEEDKVETAREMAEYQREREREKDQREREKENERRDREFEREKEKEKERTIAERAELEKGEQSSASLSGRFDKKGSSSGDGASFSGSGSIYGMGAGAASFISGLRRKESSSFSGGGDEKGEKEKERRKESSVAKDRAKKKAALAAMRDRALEDAERCVMKDPTDSVAWQCKAHALIAMGRFDDAQKEIKRGLEICPADDDEESKVGIDALTSLLREVNRRLDAEEHVQNESGKAKESAARSARSGPVEDTSLYDTLGVATDATDGMIKKAYYMKAKKCHPDRHPDDPESTEKFQKLGEAYQILSNSQQRALYDAHGLDGLKDRNFETMDPGELFDILFGSDEFEFLIGKLQLASLASNVDEDGNPPEPETLERIRCARVRKLVDELLRILMPWLEGDKTAFVQWANTKASCLSEINNGHAMLFVIGQTYLRKAEIALGKNHLLGIPSMFSSLGYSTYKFSSHVKASGATLKVLDKQRRMQEQVEKMEADGTVDQEETNRLALDMVENAFDMMWKITIVDIQSTLDEVADYILQGRDLLDKKEKASTAELDSSERELQRGMTGTSSSSNLGFGSSANLGMQQRVPSFTVAGGEDEPRRRNSSTAAGRTDEETGSSDSGSCSAHKGAGGLNIGSIGNSIRHSVISSAAFASKLSLDSVEKGLERFLLPKKEHREGKAVRLRDDVLHARATGLKRLGRVFMHIGQGADMGQMNLGSMGGDDSTAGGSATEGNEGGAADGPPSPQYVPGEQPATNKQPASEDVTSGQAAAEPIRSKRTATPGESSLKKTMSEDVTSAEAVGGSASQLLR